MHSRASEGLSRCTAELHTLGRKTVEQFALFRFMQGEEMFLKRLLPCGEPDRHGWVSVSMSSLKPLTCFPPLHSLLTKLVNAPADEGKLSWALSCFCHVQLDNRGGLLPASEPQPSLYKAVPRCSVLWPFENIRKCPQNGQGQRAVMTQRSLPFLLDAGVSEKGNNLASLQCWLGPRRKTFQPSGTGV